MNLRDLSTNSENKVSKEARSLSEFVRDESNSLSDRLIAFEDIINLEVGDTSLSRSRNIERDHDFRQLFLKFEGDNPTGTQKDRIGFAQVYDAMRRGFDTITLATCGNYGASVALASNLAGLKCNIYIPEGYHTDRLIEMENLGSNIFRLPGSYEDAVTKSSELALDQESYDANPGGDNKSLQIIAYSQIAFEIYDQLRDAPKICAVPVSNGTLLAGIHRGFVSLFKRGKTSRIPKFLAASSTLKNPIIHSFKKNLTECEDLNPQKIKETLINEPLINWHSFDGDEALSAIIESGGYAYNISDKNMKKMSSYLKQHEGKNILPASTAGLIGLLNLNDNEALESDRYVAVLTAKN
ncbi:MAG: pyridoxal-phosphate dependent enzyme [Balneola sp.]